MSSKPAESGASAAVDEAIRTISAASQPNPATTGPFIHAWGNGLEAVLIAGFEVQNAALAATPSLLETIFTAQKSVLAAWTAVIERQQQATLSVWRRMRADTDRLLTPRA
jgi:hypothetical protein